MGVQEMNLKVKKKTVEEIEEEKKDEKKKADNARRKKADKIRKDSGLKMKKIHLHQETLRDLKKVAEERGFETSDDELGYDDLSCLITLLTDHFLDNESFETTDYDTVMLKRLHLTVKHCQYEDDSIFAMDEYDIAELFQSYKYTLKEETIELLLDRKASDDDFNWSPDVINALADEKTVKLVILKLTDHSR